MFKEISHKTLGADAIFWLIWLAVTIAGFAVVWGIFEIISLSCSCSAMAFLLEISNKEPGLFAALMGLMIGLPYGAIVGLLQWIILRKQIERSNSWVGLTGLGGVLGWAAVALIPGSYDPRNFFSLVIYPMAISAIAMAVVQGWALRPAWLDSLWWVLAAIVPWILIEFDDFISALVGVNNFVVPLMLFSAGMISAAAVYVFGQSEQRRFDALTFACFSLLAIIIGSVLA